MKARVKETGEIIDVECLFYAKIGSTDPIIHNNLVEILKDDEIIDWEQRHYELVKAMIQGFCSNPNEEIRADSNMLSEWSICFVNSLIERLKGE